MYGYFLLSLIDDCLAIEYYTAEDDFSVWRISILKINSYYLPTSSLTTDKFNKCNFNIENPQKSQVPTDIRPFLAFLWMTTFLNIFTYLHTWIKTKDKMIQKHFTNPWHVSLCRPDLMNILKSANLKYMVPMCTYLIFEYVPLPYWFILQLVSNMK